MGNFKNYSDLQGFISYLNNIFSSISQQLLNSASVSEGAIKFTFPNYENIINVNRKVSANLNQKSYHLVAHLIYKGNVLNEILDFNKQDFKKAMDLTFSEIGFRIGILFEVNVYEQLARKGISKNPQCSQKDYGKIGRGIKNGSGAYNDKEDDIIGCVLLTKYAQVNDPSYVDSNDTDYIINNDNIINNIIINFRKTLISWANKTADLILVECNKNLRCKKYQFCYNNAPNNSKGQARNTSDITLSCMNNELGVSLKLSGGNSHNSDKKMRLGNFGYKTASYLDKKNNINSYWDIEGDPNENINVSQKQFIGLLNDLIGLNNKSILIQYNQKDQKPYTIYDLLYPALIRNGNQIGPSSNNPIINARPINTNRILGYVINYSDNNKTIRLRCFTTDGKVIHYDLYY